MSLPTYYGTNNRLMTALQELATRDTAEYFYGLTDQPEFIPCAGPETTFADLDESKAHLRALCFDHVEGDGFVAEYGVDSGKSLIQLCEFFADDTVYGFDAFKGLPGGAWPGNVVHKGEFDYGGTIPFDVPDNATIVNGWFEDTLPNFDYGFKRAKFLHIDCDVYSSTVQILANIGEYLTRGTVVVFDDYCNHTNWRQGEWKAWQEFLQQQGYLFGYKYLYVAGMSVGLKIT